MFEWITSTEAWIALATLVGLEIVLGIDNIIFISVLVSRLPKHERERARKLGIFLAMLARLLLLFSIVWMMTLVAPLFTLWGHEISGRDLILILGGLFLLAKSTTEIHHSLESIEEKSENIVKVSFASVLVQIALVDIIFSVDSVITAVGMVDQVSIMVIAILVSVGVMLLSAQSIGNFVDRNPSIKMLALSFLILIGVTLMGEGLDMHVPKGYIYFAMAFSVSVELLNIKVRSKLKTKPVQLQKKYMDEPAKND